MLNYELTIDGMLISDDHGETVFTIDAANMWHDKKFRLQRVKHVPAAQVSKLNGFLPIETIDYFDSLEAAKYRALSDYLESPER